MTWGLLWFCLPAAALGLFIGALMAASGHASEVERREQEQETT